MQRGHNNWEVRPGYNLAFFFSSFLAKQRLLEEKLKFMIQGDVS
jgi:hypothetical protein